MKQNLLAQTYKILSLQSDFCTPWGDASFRIPKEARKSACRLPYATGNTEQLQDWMRVSAHRNLSYSILKDIVRACVTRKDSVGLLMHGVYMCSFLAAFFSCSSFNDVVISSDYIAQSDVAIHEYLIGNDMEENCRCLIRGATPAFARRN